MQLIYSGYILEKKIFQRQTLSHHYYYYYGTIISVLPYLYGIYIASDSNIMHSNYKTQYKDFNVIHLAQVLSLLQHWLKILLFGPT